jgi:hypothetical protein
MLNITSKLCSKSGGGRGGEERRGEEREENLFFFYEIVGDTGIYIYFKVRPQLADFFRTRVETQHIRGDNEGMKFIQKPRKDLSEIVTYIFINPASPNFTLNEYLTLYLPFIQHKCTPPLLPSTVNAATPVM